MTQWVESNKSTWKPSRLRMAERIAIDGGTMYIPRILGYKNKTFIVFLPIPF
jgi:hypothetical protein